MAIDKEFEIIINERINYRILEFGIKDWQFKEDVYQEMLLTLLECEDKTKEEKIGAINNKLLNYIIREYLPFYEFTPRKTNKDLEGKFTKGSNVVMVEEDFINIHKEDEMDLIEILLRLDKEERKILAWVALGYTHEEIGEKLGCVRQTAAKRIKCIQDKARKFIWKD